MCAGHTSCFFSPFMLTRNVRTTLIVALARFRKAVAQRLEAALSVAFIGATGSRALSNP